MGDSNAVESVDDFRRRACQWFADNLVRDQDLGGDVDRFTDYGELVKRHRKLQRSLWDGGFAGICFPKAYGGLGLGPEYRQAFNEEAVHYEMPTAFNIPTFGIIAATLLDFGTEAQLQRHIPAMLRGDELWSQFLSEPSGGSDVAGTLTSAVRDGEEWVLNGSKIWTTFADHADYALCLARTNWDAPKHRGLSVFIVKIHQPSIEIRRIEMVNGSNEFCEEFLTDVRVPADAIVGKANEGWTVGTRWMFHERNGAGGGSSLTIGRGNGSSRGPSLELADLAQRTGAMQDPRGRDLVGEAWVLGRVQEQLIARVTAGISTGKLPDNSAGLMRLFRGVASTRQATIALDLAGSDAAAWNGEDEILGRQGIGFVMRQTACLGGGSTEMARNVISERLLGMPREMSADRDVPFREVRKNARPRVH